MTSGVAETREYNYDKVKTDEDRREFLAQFGWEVSGEAVEVREIRIPEEFDKIFGGYNETKRLLDLGSAGYKTAQILFPDQVVQQRSVVNGDCDVMIGTRGGAASVIPANVPDNGLEYRYVDEISMTAPIEKGQTVATMQVWCGGVCVGQTELYAMNRVRSAGSQFESNRPAGNGPKPVSVLLYLVGAVVCIILLGFVALCVLRATRIAKAKRQSRRHRQRRHSNFYP